MTRITCRLRHWYYLFRAAMRLAPDFALAGWYFKNRALKDLALPYPEALNSKEKRRLKHYYYGTTYLNTIFCTLIGYRRSRREKHLFSNLSALACFFDDLVDAFRQHDNSGITWSDNPELFGQTADPRGLAQHFLNNVYRDLPAADLAEFNGFMHRVFNVETRSAEAGTGIDDLKRITAEKGGASVLLFRRILSRPVSEAEQHALFQFGYFIQFADDIFDLWHDRRAGIVTLATHFAARNDVASLQQLFVNQVDAMHRSLAQAGRTGSAAQPTTRAIIHFLVGITRVCLRHYADLQKKHGTLPLDDRSAMVVDMERWENRVRAVREVLMGN